MAEDTESKKPNQGHPEKKDKPKITSRPPAVPMNPSFRFAVPRVDSFRQSSADGALEEKPETEKKSESEEKDKSEKQE